MTERRGVFATVLLATVWVSACSGSLAKPGDANGGTSGQGGVSGMGGTSSSGGVSGKGGASGQGGMSGQSGSAQPDAEVDAPVDVGIDADRDAGFQDCGVVPPRGSVTWIDSGRASTPIPGSGSATLSLVGDTATFTLSADYSNGTLSGESEYLTAVLTSKATLPAATYACGASATATYRTRMGTFTVASCAVTLDNEIVPACQNTVATGSFSMTLVDGDGGSRLITDGKFNVGVTQLVPQP